MSTRKNFGEQFCQLTATANKIDCPVFGNLLGVELPTDEIPLIFSEGLSAILAGMIKCVVTDLQVTPTGDIEIHLNEAKVQQSGFDQMWAFYSETDVPSSIHACRYQQERAGIFRRVVFTQALTASGSVVDVKYGMVDVTAFSLVMMLVLREFINQGTQKELAKDLLIQYKKLLVSLKAIGELPLTGTSGFKAKVDAGDFTAKNVQAVQITGLISLIYKTMNEFVAKDLLSQTNCELKPIADNNLPGMDFVSSMADEDWMKTLIETEQLPVPLDSPPVGKPEKTTNKTAASDKPKVKRPAFLDDATLSSAAKQMRTARFLRSGNGGCFHQLMIGPPSTGKSTIVKYAKDLPCSSVSFSASGDRTSVLGNFASTLDENGNRVFTPILGKMTEVWRSGMLLALRAALQRGKHPIDKVLTEFSALPITETLANLLKDPTDLNRLREFEAFATPTDHESWRVVQKAYFQSGAADIGATVRFNVEEIFHSAANRDVQNLLTTALDDRRELDPSAAGFNCATLYGYNVQVVATGNPDLTAPLQNAIKSRFSSLAYVGIPDRAEKLKRAQAAMDSAIKAADGERLIEEPLSMRLEDSIRENDSTSEDDSTTKDDSTKKEESLSEPEFVKPTALSDRAAKAILDFVEWTETSYKKLEIPSYLDGRAINQMFLTAGVYQTWGESPKSAATKALEPLIYSLAVIDHKGLPVQEKLEAIRTKAEAYFAPL